MLLLNLSFINGVQLIFEISGFLRKKYYKNGLENLSGY